VRTRDCPQNQCIVERISELAATLADGTETPMARTLALTLLVHFVGDIHMPFHALDPFSRRGGVWVRVGEKFESLHLLWDNDFVDALASDERELADILADQFPPERRSDWTQGSPVAWANESFLIARGFMQTYHLPAAMRANRVTPDATIVLDAEVFDHVKPIIAERLYRAGLRLARLLNDAFE
jgi:hypothetical protein